MNANVVIGSATMVEQPELSRRIAGIDAGPSSGSLATGEVLENLSPGTRREADIPGHRSAVPRLKPLQSLDLARQAPAAVRITAREQVAAESFPELDVSLEPEIGTYWCWMRPQGRPSFTPALLRGLSEMQASLPRLFADHPEEPPIRYFVTGSRVPGTFNLGGDLSLFADRIRLGDRQGLSAYATACIDVVHANAVNYALPIVTIGLAQGDALGGGFEALLSFDVIVAERGVKFGFPEVVFNLFPGMGAFSFLSRRLGSARASEMIASGRLYEAEELHEMGLVTLLAAPGEGEQAVRDYIARNSRRHNAHRAMFAAARRVQPLPYEELADVVDLWVDAAMCLGDADLRRMERLVSAQNRRQAGEAARL